MELTTRRAAAWEFTDGASGRQLPKVVHCSWVASARGHSKGFALPTGLWTIGRRWLGRSQGRGPDGGILPEGFQAFAQGYNCGQPSLKAITVGTASRHFSAYPDGGFGLKGLKQQPDGGLRPEGCAAFAQGYNCGHAGAKVLGRRRPSRWRKGCPPWGRYLLSPPRLGGPQSWEPWLGDVRD